MNGCRPSLESLRIDCFEELMSVLRRLSEYRILHGFRARTRVQAAFRRLVFLHALYYNAKQSERGARHLNSYMLCALHGVRVKEF